MPRPSLTELAHQHALRRWPRKKRNADLRRHGYDPDGADGELYRDAFHRACQSAEMGDYAAGMAETAHVTYLWEVPDDQWPEWIAQGCGDMPLSEYRERLALVTRQIEASGGRVGTVAATVAEVLATVAELGMQNDPAGRAAAIGTIGAKHG